MLTYTIGQATASDAGELARLLTLLGHPTSEDGVRERWEAFAVGDNAALVARRDDGKLAGALTLHQMRVLHRPRPVGRITALIVDTPYRGQGVGAALVAASESVMAHAGCGLLEVTSNDKLTDAHAFYERIGYSRTGIRLAKSVAPVR